MEMAPIVIKFMLACYCTPEPGEHVGVNHWNSDAGRETRNWLFENDLIDANFRATPRGEAWVKFICATPLPESVWMLPQREAA